jgi:hypothetical protein
MPAVPQCQTFDMSLSALREVITLLERAQASPTHLRLRLAAMTLFSDIANRRRASFGVAA